jgi:AI-2 transport protein TqsA
MARQSESQMIGPIATGILVLALLHFAQAIFVPLAFALFVIALVWPIQSALQRRLPRLIALLITIIATLAVIVAISSSVAWGIGKLGQWLFANAGRFQLIYASWTDWLEGHGVAIAGILADRFDVRWLVGFTQGMAGRLNSFAGFALLVLVFTSPMEGRSCLQTARLASNCAAS